MSFFLYIMPDVSYYRDNIMDMTNCKIMSSIWWVSCLWIIHNCVQLLLQIPVKYWWFYFNSNKGCKSDGKSTSEFNTDSISDSNIVSTLTVFEDLTLNQCQCSDLKHHRVLSVNNCYEQKQFKAISTFYRSLDNDRQNTTFYLKKNRSWTDHNREGMC